MKHKMLVLRELAIALTLVIGVIGSAHATEYISNGSFSAGTAGWSVNSNAFYTDSSGYHEGAFAEAPIGYLSQTISGAVGALTLQYDFMGAGYDGWQNTYWNGGLLSSVGVTPNTHYSFSVTGAGSDVLLFEGHNECCYNALNNVSLITAVPEPETYAMMLAGLGVLGFMARRRKQKAATA